MPILATAREVASGMAHLHSMNILHGDLTSLNVLLTSSDLDSRGFIAKVSQSSARIISVIVKFNIIAQCASGTLTSLRRIVLVVAWSTKLQKVAVSRSILEASMILKRSPSFIETACDVLGG